MSQFCAVAVETEKKKVEEEIKLRNVDVQELEKASIKALNTLALVHLKLSDQLSKKGYQKKAIKSVRTAIKHLQNTVDMSSSKDQKMSEAVIINELRVHLESLEKNGYLDENNYTISVNDLVRLIYKL